MGDQEMACKLEMLGHVQSTAEVPLSKAPNPPTHCSERLLKAAASPTPLPLGLHAHAFIMRSYIQHVSCTHNHSVITATPPHKKNNGFCLTEKKLAYRNTKCNIKAKRRSQFVSGQTNTILYYSFIIHSFYLTSDFGLGHLCPLSFPSRYEHKQKKKNKKRIFPYIGNLHVLLICLPHLRGTLKMILVAGPKIASTAEDKLNFVGDSFCRCAVVEILETHLK